MAFHFLLLHWVQIYELKKRSVATIIKVLNIFAIFFPPKKLTRLPKS